MIEQTPAPPVHRFRGWVIVRLTEGEMMTCERAARDRLYVTQENFSYATQEAEGGQVTSQYNVELVGAKIEAAFAKWFEIEDEEWTYVGRRPGSTDFRIGRFTLEAKGTWTPPARNPHLAILPNGKKSDLYVLGYTRADDVTPVMFLGWAKLSDFPTRATVLPGWRNPTLHIAANRLRKFRTDG